MTPLLPLNSLYGCKICYFDGFNTILVSWLLSLMAPQFVRTRANDVVSDDRVGIKTTLGFQCRLTQCGLMTQYGDINLGQHGSRWWLVAIMWTNVALSSMELCGMHLTVMSQKVLKNSIRSVNEKFPHLSWVLRNLKNGPHTILMIWYD